MKIDVQKIRMARLVSGYSQADLAQKAGVTLLTVNLLEARKTKMPHPSTMKKICDALDIPISDIYIGLS